MQGMPFEADKSGQEDRPGRGVFFGANFGPFL
jgi:hypothetical protein